MTSRLATALAALAVCAFSQAPTSSFVMADIHPSPEFQGMRGFAAPFVGDGRYEIRKASLFNLIVQAYGVDADKVLGGPDWLEWDVYDINAKLPPGYNAGMLKPMLRDLLADRFKLVVHDDKRDLPAYALTAGKAPKLRPSDGKGDTGCHTELVGPGVVALPGGGRRIDPSVGPVMNSFSCHGMTMEAFVTPLRSMVFDNGVTYPVIDRTDLKGAWDFDFRITLRNGPQFASAPGEIVTIFDAVDKQLGLKLTRVQAPRPVLVVESARQPTPNAPGVTEAMAIAHRPEFDVADVKPTAPDERGGRLQVTKGGGVNIQNIPLRTLIIQAYGIPYSRLVAAPDMDQALRTNYTIMAKPPLAPALADSRDATPATNPQSPAASIDDTESAWSMMRALLKDRFRLQIHQEERPLSAWKLVAVKPKMKKADPSERIKIVNGPIFDGKDPRSPPPSRSRLVTYQNVTMDRLAGTLESISDYVTTPVMNATNLEGGYDFALNFSPSVMTGANTGGPGGPGTPDAVDPNGAITLFEAIAQQLGLRLVEDKRPVPVYVIDRVDSRPSDN